MSLAIAERVYPYLPICLQNVACSFHGLREASVRLNRSFEHRLQWLLESDKWSEAEIAAYQDEQVQALVKHCYEHVPYYRRRMRENGIAPADVRTRADLVKLPVLSKEEVRDNLEALVADNVNRRKLIRRHTSGTTGTSLWFYSSRESIAFQWAVWWRHRIRFGLKPSDWHVNFTGKPVAPPQQSTPPYWRWSTPLRQAVINMHHLSIGKIGSIIEFLNSEQFVFYSGYPSIIHDLALTAKEAGLKLHLRPRCIVTGAENVLEEQRRDVEEFTGAVLTDQYGASEGCGNASQCEHFKYHEDFEFGILETVPIPSAESVDGSVPARILCTGFSNSAFPLLRYEIGDVAFLPASQQECPCGRQSRIIERIAGRIDDYVLTPEGNRIMRFDYVFKDAQHAKECQVLQERLGEITVRVVRRPSYSGADEALIRDEIRKWISPTLRVSFEYLGSIPRERNGKFRAVKSTLGRNETRTATRAVARGNS